MFGNKRLPAAFFAGGLVALVALAGCKKEPSMASKSAAAFQEARKRGETIGGGAHGGHGPMTSGGGHEMPGTVPEDGSAAGHSGMPMAGMDHSKMPMKGMDHSKMPMKGMNHSGMAKDGMDHSKMPMKGMDHSGMAKGGMDHSQMPMKGMDHSAMPTGGMDHSKMPMQGMDHPSAAPAVAAVTVSPGQPAMTLRPDALDSPATTSVANAQRSAAMAGEMTGMSGHGQGTYHQVDAGREPQPHEGSEPQAPAAEPHHHHPAPPPPPPSGPVQRRQG